MGSTITGGAITDRFVDSSLFDIVSVHGPDPVREAS